MAATSAIPGSLTIFNEYLDSPDAIHNPDSAIDFLDVFKVFGTRESVEHLRETYGPGLFSFVETFFVRVWDIWSGIFEFSGQSILAIGKAIQNVLLTTAEFIADLVSATGTAVISVFDKMADLVESVDSSSLVAASIVSADKYKELIYETEGNVIYSINDSDAAIELAHDQHLIVGSLTTLDGLHVVNFGIKDEVFVAAAQFEAEELQRKKGSAILSYDADNDGVNDMTITLEGNFRLDSFVVENVADGTFIRYLGNETPIAANDIYETSESSAIVIESLLRNDIDIDGDALTVSDIDLSETRGLVTDNGDGTFNYDPNGAFDLLEDGEVATDSFFYFVTDGVDTVRGTVEISITGESNPTPAINTLVGTLGSDNLMGTSGADAIYSLGGDYDRMTGGAGADEFIFGAEASNGRRERDVIMDYEVGVDSIVLIDGATVGSVRASTGGAVIFLEGDGDAIYVRGDGVTDHNLTIFADAEFDFG